MQHPDEGTIHAWLDGALPAGDARALEAHVAECAQCAVAVTEARGLLAASSRILSALDSVPGGVLPAAEPESGEDERIIPIGRSSLWRSPGLRAAAAILLVGSVSWLATRSVGREGAGTVASTSEMSSAVLSDRAVPSSGRTQAESVARPAQASAPSSAPRMAQSAARPRATEDRESTAGAGKRAVPAAPVPQVVTAPQVVPYAMPKLVESPNAGVGAGAAGRVGMLAQSAAPTAQAAPPATSGNASLREERSAADVGVSMRSAAKAAPRMKASAPGAVGGALPAMDAARSIDADAVRLAGCYRLETTAAQSAAVATGSVASLVPARVELSLERDTTAGGSWRVLRPAPGAPRFQIASRARWMMVTADSVRLELGEGTESVRARLAVRGDSIHGYAIITAPMLSPAGTGTDMRGSRIPCSTP